MFQSRKNSKTDFIDIEKQIHRESEGQDTITPLTNAIYIKQINKLKHHGSTKSVNSTISSSSVSLNSSRLNNTLKTPDQMSIKSNFSNRLKANIPESFLNLFKKTSSTSDNLNDTMFTQSGYFENNQININNENVSLRPVSAMQSPRLAHSKDRFNTTYSKISNNESEAEDLLNKSFNIKNNYIASASTCSSTKVSTLNHKNKTDEVYDAISYIMHNPNNNNVIIDKEFIHNIKIIVQKSELVKKKKLDKSIFICRVMLLIFFIFMSIFILVFLKTLNSIANNFLTSNNFNPQSHLAFSNTSAINASITSFKLN